MTVAVCVKWVDLRPEVDPLSGAVHHDARSAGASESDLAAVEWALRAGTAWGEPVLAVTAGPEAADTVLREALAAGAHDAARVDMAIDAPSDIVAAALAAHLGGCRLVVCGDVSADRGSGSVPAFLAARLGAAQALGLVALEIGQPGAIPALRRLDGGRRERLLVRTPAVCSVEGATARLRRAPLAAVLQARTATIAVHPGPTVAAADGHRARRPYRPRARALAPPHGDAALDRVRQLTAAGAVAVHGQPETLEPAAAAARVLESLVAWGFGRPPEPGG
jgi:electron transfer flavoprotein beta subunit